MSREPTTWVGGVGIGGVGVGGVGVGGVGIERLIEKVWVRFEELLLVVAEVIIGESIRLEVVLRAKEGASSFCTRRQKSIHAS